MTIADIDTRIDGYLVELSLFEENDEQRSFCHITKGKFNGSLELLEGMGVLDDENGNEHEVPAATIDRISAWAEENGY